MEVMLSAMSHRGLKGGESLWKGGLSLLTYGWSDISITDTKAFEGERLSGSGETAKTGLLCQTKKGCL